MNKKQLLTLFITDELHRRINEHTAASSVATLLAEHDVFRFEVSVDDAAGVEVTQGQGDLSKVEATDNTLMQSRDCWAENAQRWVLLHHNLASPHHAVSSMKIPSFSSCMKSSPPDSRAEQNGFSRVFASQHFLTPPSLTLVTGLRAYHWDTPGWGRVFLPSGRRRAGPQWTGVSPSPESLAPLVCELCPLRYKLFWPAVQPKENRKGLSKKREIHWT